MQRVAAKFLLFFLCTSIYGLAAADGPWYTGPLLAPAGHTIPKGHTNFEPYAFITDNDGIFNRYWRLTHVPHSNSVVGNPIFTHGLTDSMDIQYSLPYSYNRQKSREYEHISDVSAILGYQLIEQGKSKWRPDLRVTLQEIFPTGKYKGLNPLNNGIDATGLGSYQTGVNLNFQHRLQFSEINYLRTRLSIAYLVPLDVNLRGITSFGGNPDTFGRIDPGNMFSIDLAGEFNLTQNWVAVMEGYYATRQGTKFRGYPGFNSKGNAETIGHGLVEEITLAPAIEYNFNENVGIIGGYWFSLTGRDTVDFKSIVIALNIFM
ncbi:Fe-S protein [Legionella beliardensis]|uniref:Fe-S protein n=1 Tax=Legionella beliardensis TaxID=91822 RepID=A0A378I3I7_9GAMM|nr:hypothetical protein [Legionella beliardensis]STX29330.1 Fe-S protein [Legionella beliardensis]